MAALSNRIRGVVVAGALAAATVLVAACDSSESTTVTTPPGYEFVPTQSGWFTTGYETFCNHGYRVYGSSGGGLAVVAGDPSCKTP